MTKRLVPAGVVLALVVGAGNPAVASAKKGWTLPLVFGESEGNQTGSIAKKCGGSRFGKYTFYNGTKIGKKISWVVFRVRLTEDGRAHKPKLLFFTGRKRKSFESEARTLLGQIKFRYAAETTPQQVQSIWNRDGSLQAAREFNPTPVRRCTTKLPKLPG